MCTLTLQQCTSTVPVLGMRTLSVQQCNLLALCMCTLTVQQCTVPALCMRTR